MTLTQPRPGTVVMLTMLTMSTLACLTALMVLQAPAWAGSSAYSVVAGKTAYLGVQISEATDHDAGGARVDEVVDDSPADRAGVRPGDIVVEFDGHVVRGPAALTEKIHARDAGDRVELVVVRDGRRKALSVELEARGVVWGSAPGGRSFSLFTDGDDEGGDGGRGRAFGFGRAPKVFSLPSGEGGPGGLLFNLSHGRPMLGVQLVDTTPELRRHLGGDDDSGVLVSKVLPGTPAEQAGIRVGDLIVAVDGREVAGSAELVAALRDKAGKSFPVRVVRDGRARSIEVTIPETEVDRPTGPRAFFLPEIAPTAPLPPLPALPPSAERPGVAPRPALAPPPPRPSRDRV